MASYKINRLTVVGQAEVFVNGEPIFANNTYEAGSTIEFTIVPPTNSDYTDASTSFGRLALGPFTGFTFSFTMPNSDISPRIVLSGGGLLPNGYGDKYRYEWKLKDNSEDRKLIIQERGYTGTVTDKKIKSCEYELGRRDSDILQTLIPSRVNFSVTSTDDEYLDLITGDIRKFRVVLYHGLDIFWTGYISPDFITTPERSGQPFTLDFTATDGIESFGSIRVIRGLFTNQIFRGGYPDFAQRAITAIAGALSQSYEVDKRAINISCELYEDRMNPNVGVFEQWRYGDNAIFNDGDQDKFISDANGRIVNEQLYIKQVLERIINPFLCRVFLWKDEWYVIRLNEFQKDQIKFYKYNGDSSFDTTFTIDNDQSTNCISKGTRTARNLYNEITATLRLGNLLKEAQGGRFDFDFSEDEWNVLRLLDGTEIYRTNFWGYVNSTPFNPKTNLPRTGNIAGISWASDVPAMRIYTTTTNQGLNDPNISYMTTSLGSLSLGDGFIAVEDANLINFKAEWILRRRSLSSKSNPTGIFQVGVLIRIGNSYLRKLTGNTFDWTTDETVITIDVDTNVDLINNINIENVVVPESGDVEVRLYQLIQKPIGGAKDLYFIDWAKMDLEVAENPALVTTEISVKGIVGDAGREGRNKYPNVYPIYETFLGDSETNMSTSAMRIDAVGEAFDGAVTESWGEESIGLLDNIVLSIANLIGQRNQSVFGDTPRVIFDPFKALKYDGNIWLINHLRINEHASELNQIELFDIGLDTEPSQDVLVSWECNEGTDSTDYVDANCRIFVNDVQLVEEFGNNTGTFAAVIGDTIRVQYFYLGLPFGSGVLTPRLRLTVNDVVINTEVLTEGEAVTLNHFFTAESNNVSILVEGIDLGT